MIKRNPSDPDTYILHDPSVPTTDGNQFLYNNISYIIALVLGRDQNVCCPVWRRLTIKWLNVSFQNMDKASTIAKGHNRYQHLAQIHEIAVELL